MSKECLTVLLCGNVDGCENPISIIIDHAKKHCFKNKKIFLTNYKINKI